MDRGQRVTCKREVVHSLSGYEWADIDLILREYGLPTSDTWNGTKTAYVFEHVQNISDATLLELRSYLVGEPSTDTGVIDKIWAPNKFKLFISHIGEQAPFATEIKEKLAAYGIDCFVAHQDIDPTLEWQDTIEIALQSCDALAALLTENFHESKWTDQEIGFCMARRVLVIPVKVDVNPYGFIGKYQALNGSERNSSEIAEQIFNILIDSPLTSGKLDGAIVAYFLSSTTWESARARSLLLSKVKTWTPELLRGIENSLESHSRIPTAFGVPERIRAILTEHTQQ